MMKMFCKILKIEAKLSLRDMNMVLFAEIMPVIVLIIIGIIYKQNVDFIEQSIGAICSISICAGGLMGLPIVISDYREKKILKKFHVTPISPIILLAVHVVIYTLYSISSTVIIWVLAGVIWGARIHGTILLFAGGWIIVLICIFSIGIFVGGVAKNSKHASVIASVLYFPMLVFSGATLPYEVMPERMQKIVDVMPLTQGIKILKCSVTAKPLESFFAPVIIIVSLAVLLIILSIKLFRWE